MFPITRWSLINAARSDLPKRQAALEELCRAYRAPVLAFVRKRSSSFEEAEDLAQSFFLTFVEKSVHADADPERGQFRLYLLKAVQNFLANAHDHATAAKRGGHAQRIPLDDLEMVLEDDPDESPEHTFERVWAFTVLERARQRMRREANKSGKLALFDRLRPFLMDLPEASQYEAVAEELGMRKPALGMVVHRMRNRLQDHVRAELAETVESRKAVDAELRALRAVLAG